MATTITRRIRDPSKEPRFAPSRPLRQLTGHLAREVGLSLWNGFTCHRNHGIEYWQRRKPAVPLTTGICSAEPDTVHGFRTTLLRPSRPVVIPLYYPYQRAAASPCEMVDRIASPVSQDLIVLLYHRKTLPSVQHDPCGQSWKISLNVDTIESTFHFDHV